VVAGAAAALALTLVLGAAAPATASEVSDRVALERTLRRRIARFGQQAARAAQRLDRTVELAQRESDRRPGMYSLSVLDEARRAEIRQAWLAGRKLRALRERRQEVLAWLATWGVFRVCPVDAPRYIHDDFGEVVDLPGVEPHVHRGSDIEAPTWTPIRAPFDGYASSSYSPLGGYQVRVHGDRGYVFNAHLIAYGRLGWVGAGTVIGYVGSTGDSTAPHDHFEWHPWDGGAVDPYYLLRLSCG
jgi:murein DD-endopeptidase MepM/ murein hydrolase activator NlpD